mgnify:CR=1 FL=1
MWSIRYSRYTSNSDSTSLDTLQGVMHHGKPRDYADIGNSFTDKDALTYGVYVSYSKIKSLFCKNTFAKKLLPLFDHTLYLSIKKRSPITTRFYFLDNGIHQEGDGVTSWRTWQNSTWVAKFLELHEYILPDLLNFTVICYQYQHIPILGKLSQLVKIKIHKIQIKYPFFVPKLIVAPIENLILRYSSG